MTFTFATEIEKGIETYSYSKIECFKACRRKFKHVYLDHLPEKPKAYFVLGRMIHLALATIFKGHREISKEKIFEEVNAKWGNEFVNENLGKWEWLVDTIEKAERILESAWNEIKDEKSELSKITPSLLEQDISILEIGGKEVHGVLDLYDTNGILWDWKSGSRMPDGAEKNPEALKKEVQGDLQLNLYATGVRMETERFPKRIAKCWFIHSKKGVKILPVIVDFNPEICAVKLQEVKELCTSLELAIENDDFPKNDKLWSCNSEQCDFYKKCFTLLWLIENKIKGIVTA